MSTSPTNSTPNATDAASNHGTPSTQMPSENRYTVPTYTNQNYNRTVPAGGLKAQIAYCVAHQYLRGNEENGQELEGMRTQLFKQGTGVLISMREDSAAESEGRIAVPNAREHLDQLVQDGSFSPNINYEGFEDPAVTSKIDVRDFRELLVFAYAYLRIKAPTAIGDVGNAADIILENHGQPEFAKDPENVASIAAGWGTLTQAIDQAEAVVRG